MKNDNIDMLPDGDNLYTALQSTNASSITSLNIETVQGAGWDFIASCDEDSSGSYYYVDIFDASGKQVASSEITEESYNSYTTDSSDTIDLVGVPLFSN